MISLTAQDGSQVLVNVDAVWHVRASGEQTAIYSTGGGMLFVREGFVEVADRVREFGKQGR